MLKAKEIMNPNPENCLLDTSINDIMAQFANKDTDYILVLDEDDRLCGIITESDLIDQQANLHVPTAMTIFDMVLPLGTERFEREVNRLQAITAEDLMISDLQSVTPETRLDELATLMSEAHIHHLPVIDGQSVEGLITKHDLIKAMASQL